MRLFVIPWAAARTEQPCDHVQAAFHTSQVGERFERGAGRPRSDDRGRVGGRVPPAAPSAHGPSCYACRADQRHRMRRGVALQQCELGVRCDTTIVESAIAVLDELAQAETVRRAPRRVRRRVSRSRRCRRSRARPTVPGDRVRPAFAVP